MLLLRLVLEMVVDRWIDFYAFTLSIWIEEKERFRCVHQNQPAGSRRKHYWKKVFALRKGIWDKMSQVGFFHDMSGNLMSCWPAMKRGWMENWMIFNSFFQLCKMNGSLETRLHFDPRHYAKWIKRELCARRLWQLVFLGKFKEKCKRMGKMKRLGI